jgi:hypothetical protein
MFVSKLCRQCNRFSIRSTSLCSLDALNVSPDVRSIAVIYTQTTCNSEAVLIQKIFTWEDQVPKCVDYEVNSDFIRLKGSTVIYMDICVSSFIQRHKQDQRKETRKRMKDKCNVYQEQSRDECVSIYIDRRTLEKRKRLVRDVFLHIGIIHNKYKLTRYV